MPVQVKKIPRCRLCNQEIVFDGIQRSQRTGKQIPLDPSTKKPHSCPNYQQQKQTTIITATTAAEIKYIKCKLCNNDIYFDDKQKTESGKFIPISRLTNQPHQCKYNPSSKKYHSAEWNGEREAEAAMTTAAIVNKAKEESNK
jgi:hypothetical protein